MWVCQEISTKLLNSLVSGNRPNDVSQLLLVLVNRIFEQVLELLSHNKFWEFCLSEYDNLNLKSKVEFEMNVSICKNYIFADCQMSTL